MPLSLYVLVSFSLREDSSFEVAPTTLAHRTPQTKVETDVKLSVPCEKSMACNENSCIDSGRRFLSGYAFYTVMMQLYSCNVTGWEKRYHMWGFRLRVS